MLLLSVALAADLTWTCPELTATEDAYPWSTPLALGALDAIDAVVATAYAAIPEECLATCGSTVDGYCESLSCVSEAGDVVSWQYTHTDWSDGHGSGGSSLGVTFDIAPVGLAWTSLVGAYAYDDWASRSHYGTTSDTVITAEATWVGALREDWPADATIRVEAGDSSSDGYLSTERRGSESWDDGACAWSASHTDDVLNSVASWGVVVGAHYVAVESNLWDCPSELQGSLDGVSVGVVEATDWSNAASDADDDGSSAGRLDCNDADPAINACARDTSADGVDQNCDGTDGEDGDVDGDGFYNDGYGGTDCDDLDPDVFPGAVEECDGVDNNCDGVVDDSPDADADGWAVCDGDCDDAHPDVNPGAKEVPDGVDNDCDGVVDGLDTGDMGSGDTGSGDTGGGDTGSGDTSGGETGSSDTGGEDTAVGDSDSDAPADTGLKPAGCEGGGATPACTTGGGSARSVAAVLVALAWGARRRARGGAR